MTVTARSAAGDAKGIVTLEARDEGNVLRTIKEGWIRAGDVLKQFYASFRIMLSTNVLYARKTSSGSTTITSPQVIATVEGAVGEVTHAWTRTAPDGHAWTILGAAVASPKFSTVASPGQSWTATFIDTVTDSAGHVLASDPVTVTLENDF